MIISMENNQAAMISVEPLLGTAASVTSAELQLAAQIDELHQIIYARGGLNSTNAAIEELSKLIFLRICSADEPEIFKAKGIDLHEVFVCPGDVDDLTGTLKTAFSVAIADSSRSIRRLSGERDGLWPFDEPFRINNESVLVRATEIVNLIADSSGSVLDPLGTAFDAFLSGRYDHSGGLGTYLTPSSVARFMADLALDLVSEFPESARTPWLMDPFCGTGRFLVAGYQALKDAGKVPGPSTEFLDHAIVGTDQSSSAIAKSALNLMLYGSMSPRTFSVSDSIGGRDLEELSGQVPLILTNPPFGGGKYDDPHGIQLTSKYFPGVSKSKIDPALGGLARCLKLLAPGGVLGIVLPDGIVNGKTFVKAMTDSVFRVVASVSLPTATFSLSGTVARTSAIFIQKETGRNTTLLARADHVGFLKKAGKAVNDPDGNDLPTIANIARSALHAASSVDVDIVSDSPLVARVANSALTSIDPSRFDSDAMKGKAELIRGEHTTVESLCVPRKKNRSKRIVPNTPFVSVLHVDAYGTIDWVRAETYTPSTLGQIVKGGDVIISLLNPSKLRAAVIPSEIELAECSPEFGVLAESKYPYALLGLLHDPRVSVQLRPLGTGTSNSRRRITINDVTDLVIPELTPLELEQLDRDVKSAVTEMERGRATLGRIFGIEDFDVD